MKQPPLAYVVIAVLACLIVVYAFFLYASRPADAWVRARQTKAIDACVTQNGIPILAGNGDVTNCQWSTK